MLNGLTHYFNLITSKINDQPGIEVFYVYPKTKSVALGEGVFETKAGVNFQLIELEEKTDEINSWLYYDKLEQVLQEVKPAIIMVGETHLGSVLYDEKIKLLIQNLKIKVVLKSIPFKLKKYEEEIADFKQSLSKNILPEFRSLPGFVSKILNLLKANLLYKKVVIDKRSIENFKTSLDKRGKMFTSVDGHVNYIEEAYDIYGSYGVPREKIFVTYNSPDTDTYFAVKEKIKHYPPLLPLNNNRIIHLSRLVEWKRVDMLITAVANLKSKYPDIELLVVGDGPEKANLELQAENLNIKDSVNFLGGVYNANLFGQYIMSSGIYVLAGMGGLSINDAMIFGLPVICSVCDGTEKYLVREGYNGLFFKEGNQQDLEKKISYLFDDPSLRESMGQNSAKIIEEEINIKNVVNRYINAFVTIAGNEKYN